MFKGINERFEALSEIRKLELTYNSDDSFSVSKKEPRKADKQFVQVDRQDFFYQVP